VRRYGSGWLGVIFVGLLLILGLVSCAPKARVSRTWPVPECPSDEIPGVWLTYRGEGVFEIVNPDHEQIHMLGLDDNGIMWVGAMKLCSAQRGEVIEEINRLAE